MKLNFLICCLALALVTGCGGSADLAGTAGSGSGASGSDTASAGTGGDALAQAPTLRISVTDAPFPSSFVEEASVVIKEVRVREASAGGWLTVFEGSSEIDLVPLTGGVSALLVEAEIEPGTYDEVRLIVDAGRVQLGDGAFTATGDNEFTVENGTLKFPSGSQTGIKVKIDNDIVVTSELSGDLMLDFDLTKSFVFNGPPSHAPGVRRVLFKPVVRATNSSTGGSIRLEARSDGATPDDDTDDTVLAGATVRICDADDTEIATVLADDSGVAVAAVAPGTYSVKVEAAAHITSTVADVEVVLANLTDLGSVTLAVSEAEITGTIRGDFATASDDSDDVVLEGATVEIRAAGDTVLVDSVETDAQGAFAFTTLAPGSYDLKVELAGYEALEVDDVDAAGPGLFDALELLLVTWTRDVSGTVTDDADAALVGATVEIFDAEGDLIGSDTTDDSGDYAISGIPTGAHTISVTPSGSDTAHTESLDVEGTDPVSDLTKDVQVP